MSWKPRISYFSVAVITHYDQSNLKKKELTLPVVRAGRARQQGGAAEQEAESSHLSTAERINQSRKDLFTLKVHPPWLTLSSKIVNTYTKISKHHHQ